MLIVRSKGQLGNQLFLYAAAMQAKRSGEKLALLGFDELFETFPIRGARWIRIQNYSQRKRTVNRLIGLLRVLCSLRLIGVVRLAPNGRGLAKTSGAFPLTLFDAGYCQEERLSAAGPILQLRKRMLVSHDRELRETFPELFEPDKSVCFIHVRRGDYLRWPKPEAPAALPDQYYLRLATQISSDNPNVRFLVFSDDSAHCEDVFKGVPNLRVVRASPTLTWLAMTMARYGVLSASTFSWWGARLAHSEDSTGKFIAPLYWSNWRNSSWPQNAPHDSSFLSWERVSP